uniref:Uncharacterized protein n=1 Tax=Helicotheca tamesis TaxID=374047 RepID=A0A6U0FPM0_9STRA
MMADMNRHCKIRFVEKSGNSASEAKGTSSTVPSPGSILDTQQKTDGSGGLLFLDNTELKGMDNDKLDSVLDSLLVRLVENLVEISCSSKQLQDDLTSPDKSGFTLLHYASLYNLQSLIPVLISHGSNPDAPTTRWRFTPLHLACVAGNEAVVDLLVRSGCTVWVYDSFNSSPADHAVRNGFPKIAQWLKDTAGEDTSGRGKKGSDSMELDQKGEIETDVERFLSQSAFSNLSLKDKLAMNLLLKRRKKDGRDGCAGDASTDEVSSNQDTDSDKLVAYFGSAISESDMESLNMAMRLMNQEELDDLENNSRGVDEDLRKWMLRRNYESLKEATLYLRHTEREKSNMRQPGDFLGSSSRGLSNVKNQAIAGLIIRKNMSRLQNSRKEPLAPS